MYDAYNGGERSRALAALAPDVTWDFTDAPDGVVYRGQEEVQRFWAMLDDVWESLRIEIEWLQERGDLVLTEVRVVGEGRDGGISIEHGETHLWRVRDGSLVEGKTYLDQARAMAAAS
jgi:ketosteroid isomerase-like protein